MTSDDNWSVFRNTTGSIWQKKSFLSSYYFLHPFIEELDVKAIAIALSRSDKLMTLSIRQQGDVRLNTIELALSYNQQFGESISLGASGHYRQYSFGDIYGKRSILFFSFGAQINLNKKESLAFLIANPSKQFIDRKNNERLESNFSFAYKHRFSKIFNASVGIEKQSNQDANFRFHWLYQFSTNFNIQGDYQLLLRRYGINSEIKLKQLILAQNVNYDAVFGLHFGIGFSYYL